MIRVTLCHVPGTRLWCSIQRADDRSFWDFAAIAFRDADAEGPDPALDLDRELAERPGLPGYYTLDVETPADEWRDGEYLAIVHTGPAAGRNALWVEPRAVVGGDDGPAPDPGLGPGFDPARVRGVLSFEEVDPAPARPSPP